MAPLTSI